MAAISVKCRFCGLTDPVKKHGTGNGGHPRYRCQACCRTFQFYYSYISLIFNADLFPNRAALCAASLNKKPSQNDLYEVILSR